MSQVHGSLDITGLRCPMTFVRTRLALDRIAPGEVLEVLLAGAEPRAGVPQASRSLGHDILSIEDFDDGVSRLLIRKRGGVPPHADLSASESTRASPPSA